MKFTSDSTTETSVSNQRGLLIPEPIRDSLVGKMCQIIEMLGLRDTQEKATKDTIKNIIYDILGHDGGAEYIESELYGVIQNVIWQERNYSKKEGKLLADGSYCLTKTIPEAED